MTSSATAASAGGRRGVEPARARLSAPEIERLISTEPVPEPFWPDDGELHYAPIPEPGAGLTTALRLGQAVLVDVFSVEVRPAEGTATDAAPDSASIVRARAVSTGDLLEIAVAAPGECAITPAPSAGERYVLILDDGIADLPGPRRLLSTPLAVLPVDADGRIRADSLVLDASAIDELAATGGAL